jgi:hydrogenase expression/formation protein HypE
MQNEINSRQIVLSSHGDGGLLTHQLLNELFMPAFSNQWLDQCTDSAMLKYRGLHLAITTDSFVVSPLFFKGGDIGKLAVCGTINDLVVSGARPLWLTAAFILPEGMDLQRLSMIAQSMKAMLSTLEVPIVTGDTKVIDSGDPENLLINTTGIGLIEPKTNFHPRNIRPSDIVIISGTIGDHGAAILAERAGFTDDNAPASDCAPLLSLFEDLKDHYRSIRVLRDPTRGGLATTMVELAEAGQVDIYLEEHSIPVKSEVAAVSGILGVDPYYLASEGRMIIIASEKSGMAILEKLKSMPGAEDSAIIGFVSQGKGNVYLRTRLGGTRRLKMLAGTPLPRIC